MAHLRQHRRRQHHLDLERSKSPTSKVRIRRTPCTVYRSGDVMHPHPVTPCCRTSRFHSPYIDGLSQRADAGAEAGLSKRAPKSASVRCSYFTEIFLELIACL